MGSLLTSYVLPLALIPAVVSILNGLLWTRMWGMKYVIITACIAFISAILSYILTTYVVDLLAPNFQSKKDLGSSAQLVAYSATANWVASILGLIPLVFIGWLGILAGAVYSIYLMYLGIGPVKKTPEDQRVIYIVIVILVLIVTSVVITWILGAMLLAGIVTTGRLTY